MDFIDKRVHGGTGVFFCKLGDMGVTGGGGWTGVA